MGKEREGDLKKPKKKGPLHRLLHRWDKTTGVGTGTTMRGRQVGGAFDFSDYAGRRPKGISPEIDRQTAAGFYRNPNK